MKNVLKIMIAALSIVLIIAAMPFTASAEAVALGNESPFISAQFLDSNGDEADGNNLAAGETYTVNLALDSISSVAIFNLTASFTDDIEITNVTSVADIENSGFEYGGYKVDTDNNQFVIVISTVNNNTYTELSGETVMVTLTVDVNTDGDFADFFEISTSRNHTFIIANFEEGNESSYVYKDLEQTSTDFPFLDFDMSPSSSITVTGTVKVATEVTGTNFSADSKVTGATIDVLDANDAVVATTTTDSDGKFSVAVPSGGVAIRITKYCVNERIIALSGNEVTDYPNIPVVAVDYSSNGAWDPTDKAQFAAGYKSENPDMDLSGNGSMDPTDKAIFKYFMQNGRTLAYGEFTL
ncbi:MAG: carboxypeptidase regulatory-like domain-containing protein [Eubacterium sp.]|nr:carboxypeptidase regulatory-like domain-containing protein [Eubacterium sp.]